MTVHAEFRRLLGLYGPFTSRVDFPPASAEALAGRMPEEVLAFWRSVGLGVWKRGRFQFCDPVAMRGVTKLVFDGDRQFSPERTHLYGYGGLGRLFFWSEDLNDGIEVDLVRLEASSMLERTSPEHAFEAFVATISNLGHPYFGISGRDGSDALPDLLAHHGGLSNGEVLAYVPALALGGSPSFENLKKRRALEHFAILAQLGSAELHRIKGGRRPVRMLGE